MIPNPYIPASLYPILVTEMTKMTYNGVPEREYRALCELENELYIEWRRNPYNIDAHNRLRGAMNVLAMCRCYEPILDLVTPQSNY